MRLGIVSHTRCGEDTFDRTFVWVPDDWTTEQFEQAVTEAQKAYLDFFDSWRAEPPPEGREPPYRPDYAKHPDKLVREVEAEHSEQMERYKAWLAERKKAKRTFGDYLVEQGLIPLWEHEPEFADTLDWGHRHGQQLDYDAEQSKDFPGPLSRSSEFEHT